MRMFFFIKREVGAYVWLGIKATDDGTFCESYAVKNYHPNRDEEGTLYNPFYRSTIVRLLLCVLCEIDNYLLSFLTAPNSANLRLNEWRKKQCLKNMLSEFHSQNLITLKRIFFAFAFLLRFKKVLNRLSTLLPNLCYDFWHVCLSFLFEWVTRS